MQTTNDFLDMLKSRLGLASDYALSKFLGCGQSRISNYRNGRSHLGDEEALLMAELLEIDPAYILATVHAERAKGEVQKRVWADIIKKIGGVAAALLLCIYALPLLSNHADGMFVLVEYVYYVKFHPNKPAAIMLLLSALFLRFSHFPRRF